MAAPAKIPSAAIVDALGVLAHDAHAIAQRRGLRSVSHGEKLMLAVRYVSKAMGEIKHGKAPESMARPLADAVITIADLAAGAGIDLGAVVMRRMTENATRAARG